MKVSRAGIDVTQAADNQLLFSSSFKSSLICQSGTLAPNSNVAHGLGYYPVVIGESGGTNTGNYNPTNGNYNFSSYGITGALSVDTYYVYTGGISNSIYYYVLPISLRQNYTAPIINSTQTSSSSPNQNYGFKASLNGYDVTTASVQHLSTYSGVTTSGNAVRIGMIHQIGYYDGLASGNTMSFNHNLGYTPLFIPYARQSGSSQYSISTINFGIDSTYDNVVYTYLVTIDSSKIYFTNNTGSSQDIAYVILKDPF